MTGSELQAGMAEEAEEQMAVAAYAVGAEMRGVVHRSHLGLAAVGQLPALRLAQNPSAGFNSGRSRAAAGPRASPSARPGTAASADSGARATRPRAGSPAHLESGYAVRERTRSASPRCSCPPVLAREGAYRRGPRPAAGDGVRRQRADHAGRGGGQSGPPRRAPTDVPALAAGAGDVAAVRLCRGALRGPASQAPVLRLAGL